MTDLEPFKTISESVLVQRIAEILSEGSRETTYKHALLMALIDWSVENAGTTRVPTSDLAEIVLRLYWDQGQPYFSAGGEALPIKQGKPGQPDVKITALVRELRAKSDSKFLHGVAKEAPRTLKMTLDSIERVLVAQPIPRLQTIGKTTSEFLYSCKWPPKQSLNKLRASGIASIELLPGVSEVFRSLGPLFRTMIEMHWIQDVAKWSGLKVEEDSLRDHLFGSEREQLLPKAREMLAEFHGNLCFYCETKLQKFHVDHFVPWSKHPNEAIENLVPSCVKCNLSKSDVLPSPRYFQLWMARFAHQRKFEEIAEEGLCESNPRRSMRVARSISAELRSGSVVWDGPNGFLQFDEQMEVTLGKLFEND